MVSLTLTRHSYNHIVHRTFTKASATLYTILYPSLKNTSQTLVTRSKENPRQNMVSSHSVAYLIKRKIIEILNWKTSNIAGILNKNIINLKNKINNFPLHFIFVILSTLLEWYQSYSKVHVLTWYGGFLLSLSGSKVCLNVFYRALRRQIELVGLAAYQGGTWPANYTSGSIEEVRTT